MKTLENKIIKIISIAIILIMFFLDIIKCDRTILEISDTKGLEMQEEVQLEPKSILKNQFYNNHDYLTITGKFCLVNETNAIVRDCFEKYENYNYEWIILADNSDYLVSIYSFLEDHQKNFTSPANILSIVINNSTIPLNESYTDGKTPLVYVDNKIYDFIKQFDISNISENFMISIYCIKLFNLLIHLDIDIKLDSEFQNRISLYLSLAFCLFIFIVTLTWHSYTFKIHARNSTSIQKCLSAMLYLKLLLSLLLVYYTYLNIKRTSQPNIEDNLMLIYVETIFSTLSDVLQTLIWFVLLIVAYGWQIHRGIFTRNEVKNAVLVFIVLYSLICFDQIINMLIEYSLWNFRPSDIKTILLFTILTIFMIIFCNKSKKLIKSRFVYAINFSREYYPSLKLKIKMMNLQSIFTILYTITYIVILVLYRTIFPNFFTKETSMVSFFIVDTLGLFAYLSIYYPRNFPQYFNIFYDEITFENSDEFKMNLFFLKLRKTDGNLKNQSRGSFDVPISSQKLKKKELDEVKKNNEIPILVINPIDYHDYNNSGNKSLHLIEKICVGTRTFKV